MKAGDVVDLAGVRRGLARLDAAAARWPELLTPNRQKRAAAWLARGGIVKSYEDKMVLNLRVAPADLDRAEALVPLVGADPAARWGRVTRASVLRMALMEGLTALEARYTAGDKAKP